MLPAGDDKPTVLKLMRMKKQDGSDLNLFATIAGNCNIESFGMFLLSDDNGSEVKVLEADYARKGTEAFVKSIITKWLMKCSPAVSEKLDWVHLLMTLQLLLEVCCTYLAYITLYMHVYVFCPTHSC